MVSLGFLVPALYGVQTLEDEASRSAVFIGLGQHCSAACFPAIFFRKQQCGLSTQLCGHANPPLPLLLP
eukprot:1137859-Pelagomonas_calceolata.AAC.3